MEIKVLGPDSFTCQKMEELTKVAIKELGIVARVEKVTDIGDIARHGVLSTPGLVLNGKVRHAGKPLPSVDAIKEMIKEESGMVSGGGR